MWIAVESILMIITEKHVTFIFYYNYFLCDVHAQTLKPVGGELLFTYSIDIFMDSA